MFAVKLERIRHALEQTYKCIVRRTGRKIVRVHSARKRQARIHLPTRRECSLGHNRVRTIGKGGLQAIMRWTPGAGSVVIELLGGRYIDSFTPSAFTLGMTLRF